MQRAPEGSFLGEVAEGVLGATGGGAGGAGEGGAWARHAGSRAGLGKIGVLRKLPTLGERGLISQRTNSPPPIME